MSSLTFKPIELAELRQHWEGNEPVIAQREHRSGLVVVTRDSMRDGWYRCYRYFPTSSEWAVSCDGSVLPEVAMQWLCNPSAATCREQKVHRV